MISIISRNEVYHLIPDFINGDLQINIIYTKKKKMETKYLHNIIIVLGLLFSFNNTNAQCGPAGNGTNGGIHCMYPDSMRNCLYVGGGFHNSGMDTINHCGYWNDSTYFPMSMMGNNGCNDSVWCFAMFNGDLYVGGEFTQAGGVACNHIARWDGTSWYAVGDGFNQPVHALAVFNNELYAGGDFTSSGATTLNYIAKWSGSQWNQIGTGTNDDVEAMCVWNNALYIGGDFTIAGGITVNRICKWDGTNFSAIGSGFTSGMGQCMVHSLCVYNGNLCAGGMFEHAGTNDMHNLAMWNGSNWSSLGDIDGSGMGDNVVSAMCAYNGHLFIGGNFGSCGSTSSSNLGMWDGSSWSSIGTGMDGEVNSLAVYHNELYIGGSFTNAAGTSVNNIAKYSPNIGIQPIDVKINSIKVYPNPAIDYVQISWINEQSSKIILSITDITGRILFEKNEGEIAVGFHQELVPVNYLSNGIYFVTLNSTDRKYSLKFQINK